MPIYYKHWSFGKEFNHNFKKYLKGHMGLAYEMVINSNPCINLLMEENLAYMQVMVMAHAGVGHNAVFKNNVYFQDWTNAESIIDYLKFASDYVQMCEERYGANEVEETLDACHAISSHSMDKYQRKHRAKDTEESIARRMLSEDLAKQKELDIILQQTALPKTNETNSAVEDFSGEENLAYYIMKNAPDLPQWKREILRITYKIANYFSPQGVTKTLNEGYASFCHYYIMQRLEEKGHITSDAYIAFLSSHAGVLYQPSYYSKHYSGPNPYAVGFKIFMDLKRICENPTDEDREYMPHIIGRKWQDVTKEAAFEYRDDSFIMQFM
jgi:spore cortex formation protein SpoVR/YcgB (stage V sporulation)